MTAPPAHIALPFRANTGGVPYLTQTCDPGDYLTDIYGNVGHAINGYGGTCSNGKVLQYIGPRKGNTFQYRGKMTQQWGNIKSGDDRLFDSGKPKAVAWRDTCPAGTYLSGYSGYTNMNGIGFLCGVDKNEFCIDNIDNDICRSMNAEILNKACIKNMSKNACTDRKNELYETTVNNFCRDHPDDPLCSCFTPPPSFIPAELSGNAKCWNNTCANRGIVPVNSRNGACPDVTVCRQDVSTSGNANQLSGNINIIDCSRNNAPPLPPPAPTATPEEIAAAEKARAEEIIRRNAEIIAANAAALEKATREQAEASEAAAKVAADRAASDKLAADEQTAQAAAQLAAAQEKERIAAAASAKAAEDARIASSAAEKTAAANAIAAAEILKKKAAEDLAAANEAVLAQAAEQRAAEQANAAAQIAIQLAAEHRAKADQASAQKTDADTLLGITTPTTIIMAPGFFNIPNWVWIIFLIIIIAIVLYVALKGDRDSVNISSFI